MAGQGDRAAEGAVAALNPVGLVPGRVARGVPLALDGQQAVFEGDLHVAGLDARELSRYQVGVFSFADVDRWRPGRGAGAAFVALARPPGPSGVHPEHLLLYRAEVIKQVPGCHDCHVVLPKSLAGPAARQSRKNTARVNTICFRATLFTI